MGTVLAFRTPLGGVALPAGESVELGRVDVSRFNEVRVVADERSESASGVSVRLALTEGQELISDLDVLTLDAAAQVTRTYSAPGSIITVIAQAATSVGTDGLDVLLYGSE